MTESKAKKKVAAEKPVKKAAEPKAKKKAAVKKPVKKAAEPKAKKKAAVKKPVKKAAESKAKKAAEKPAKKDVKPVKEPDLEVVKADAVPATVPEVKVKKPKARKPKPVVKIKYSGDGSLEKSGKSKPCFNKQEYGKIFRVKSRWRSSRGTDSKKAEGKRGRGKSPCIGYGNPSSMSGIVRGFKPLNVEKIMDLEGVDPKTQAIIISARLGRRKRNQIIEEANKLKLTVLNPRKGEI
ncbi:MAG: eL32 family ribosomal protein [Candidatus Altiarchaeota archaeon]